MPFQRETLLCHYHYDALDRLIGTTPLKQAELQRFYCKSRLASEIQGQIQRSIVQHGDQLLAQQQRQGNALDTTLLATDQQRSVLHTLKANNERHPIAYSPYGYYPAESGLTSLLGFNGERPDPVTGHYLLGNGYRAFNPVLMRFNSPDSWSPFGKGGLNPYAYCLGDPINQTDSNGHIPILNQAQRISAFLKNNRRLPGSSRTVNLALSPEQALDFHDQIKAQIEIMISITKEKNLSFITLYKNRNLTNLKAAAAKAATDFNLPLDSIPGSLKAFVKNLPPPHAKDVLETIAKNNNGVLKYDITKLHEMSRSRDVYTNQPKHFKHSSGRVINPETAKELETMINIRQAEFSRADKKHDELLANLYF